MRFPIDLPPGVFRAGTELQSQGRYYDSDLVRWRNGALEPVGGWRDKTASTVNGAARSIIVWSANSGQAWVAVGTHSNLYVMDRGGTVTDITPIRATAALTDPFAVTNGSAVVVVTDTAHGAITGDEVVFSGASAVGGITLSGAYTLTKTGDDTYTVTHSSAGTSTASGGGSVTAKYRISPGLEDSDFRGGYGNGLYGVGTYGTPRPDNTNPSDVSVWSLDTFGENLVACRADDGGVYEWSLNTSNPAVLVSGAPTGRCVVSTSDRILMVGGENGNPRALKWSDQEDNTQWTAATTNYAGDFILQTPGKIMAMRRVRGGTLILTTADAWLAEFLGQPLVYGFEQKGGAGTGVVSQGAVATMDGEAVPASAVWMGPQGFFAYNGFVQPLDCDVAGLVFTDINRTQITKVSAFHNADFGEVWWFYPSASSTEIDRYVVWNYRENWWSIGYSMDRLCGCEKGPLANPLAVDAAGTIHEHEVGLDYDGAEPFAETGPFQIGDGSRVVNILRIIPDEKTLGDVDVTFYTRFQPKGSETTRGPYTLSAETNIRFTSREIRVRFSGARLAAWRVGNFELEGQPGGGR